MTINEYEEANFYSTINGNLAYDKHLNLAHIVDIGYIKELNEVQRANYVVYHCIKDESYYIGRSKDYKRRMEDHKPYLSSILFETDDKDLASLVERGFIKATEEINSNLSIPASVKARTPHKLSSRELRRLEMKKLLFQELDSMIG